MKIKGLEEDYPLSEHMLLFPNKVIFLCLVQQVIFHVQIYSVSKLFFNSKWILILHDHKLITLQTSQVLKTMNANYVYFQDRMAAITIDEDHQWTYWIKFIYSFIQQVLLNNHNISILWPRGREENKTNEALAS